MKGPVTARLLNTAVIGSRNGIGQSASVLIASNGAILILDHSAVAGNHTSASIDAGAGTGVVLRSSILENTDRANFVGSGRFESAGLNLTNSAVEDVWEPAGPTDWPKTDPRVTVPPGGAFFLDLDSPAIDADDCVDAAGSVVAGDIRGAQRPVGVTCDIGPFEANGEVSDGKDPNAKLDDLGTKIDLQKEKIAIVKLTVDDTKIGVDDVKMRAQRGGMKVHVTSE